MVEPGATAGRRWEGTLGEIEMLGAALPNLTVIAYGVDSPERLAALQRRVQVGCNISLKAYASAAAQNKGPETVEALRKEFSIRS